LAQLVRILLFPADVVMIYLLAVMLAALRLNRGAALAAAALAGGAYNFFFVPPLLAFSLEDMRHLLSFALMFAVGLAISALASRLRKQEEEARVRERRTAALYSLTRELSAAGDGKRAAEVVTRQAAALFGRPAAVLLSTAGELEMTAASDDSPQLPEEDMAAARRAGVQGRPAGRWTGSNPSSQATFLPLETGSAILGVLALFGLPSREALEAGTFRFLEAFARQSAIAIERVQLTEKAKEAAVRIQAEQMRNTILSAVSHDLRTPLGAITGAGTALRTICTEADRMDRLGGRELKLDLPADLPFVYMNPVLFEQVFVNLIENALKYTGQNSPLEIRARTVGGSIQIDFADRGPGLPNGEEERVFEKFYRGPKARGGGLGLGLSICRSILKAHGASITGSNREGGGAVFRIELPVPESPPSPEIAEEAPS
jgi:two-component system sensor histidine kinase KdpD